MLSDATGAFGEMAVQLLHFENFGPHVNSTFSLKLGETTVEMALTEATRQVVRPFPGMMREPFSLIFRSSMQIVLPQRMYTLTHPAMGQIDMFMVPIGRDVRGVVYQAIYN
jgi:hypothetical protein